MNKDSDAIQRVRDVRHQVSSKFDHDPSKVIGHYVSIQLHLRDRLLAERVPAKAKRTRKPVR
jgi:hypothetical protein